MKWIVYICFLLCLFACNNKIDIINDAGGQSMLSKGCEGVDYPDWETSLHVLPYPVGQAYKIGRSNCGGGTHAEGQPDQFSIDFKMPIGTLVTAVRKGTIMFVEESGEDYGPTNNMVVLRDEDGYFFQYQHLTMDGALVEVGNFVEAGDPIGLSGASGLALEPYLHFVPTRFGDWEAPYSRTYPVTFRNTSPNPRSLLEGEIYEALAF